MSKIHFGPDPDEANTSVHALCRTEGLTIYQMSYDMDEVTCIRCKKMFKRGRTWLPAPRHIVQFEENRASHMESMAKMCHQVLEAKPGDMQPFF